jgi:hypothetical protein
MVLQQWLGMSPIFWGITSFSELEVNRRFGGTRRFHLLYFLTASGMFLVWLILRYWRWVWHIPPKRRLTSNGIYGITSQKIRLLISLLSPRSCWRCGQYFPRFGDPCCLHPFLRDTGCTIECPRFCLHLSYRHHFWPEHMSCTVGVSEILTVSILLIFHFFNL